MRIGQGGERLGVWRCEWTKLKCEKAALLVKEIVATGKEPSSLAPHSKQALSASALRTHPLARSLCLDAETSRGWRRARNLCRQAR